ncbi:MAG: hypothetical protein LDL41_19330 [Coleofasciculus sp. S288]|nr:hypothetical protein [Coleofasciculus sp. S288]
MVQPPRKHHITQRTPHQRSTASQEGDIRRPARAACLTAHNLLLGAPVWCNPKNHWQQIARVASLTLATLTCVRVGYATLRIASVPTELVKAGMQGRICDHISKCIW